MVFTLRAFLADVEVFQELESDNKNDIADNDVNDLLLNNMSDTDEDCDRSGHDSGTDAQYSWRIWNDGDTNFPDFPCDSSNCGFIA